MPRVAVITPTYNRGHNGLLEKTMLSVLGQSFHDFLYVIVDDGSTDNTSDVVGRYAGRDRRVVYHRKERGTDQRLGASAARNFGIECLDDYDVEFVTFLDSDDLYTRDCIEKKLTACTPGIRMVYSWLGAFRGMSPVRVMKGENTNNPLEMAAIMKSRQSSCFPYLTMFLSASLLNEVGKFDENLAYGEDRDFSVRTLERLREGEMAVVPEILHYYRLHDDGVCGFYNGSQEASSDIKYFFDKHGRTRGVATVEMAKQFLMRPHTFLPEVIKRRLRPLRDEVTSRFSDFELEPFAQQIESREGNLGL